MAEATSTLRPRTTEHLLEEILSELRRQSDEQERQASLLFSLESRLEEIQSAVVRDPLLTVAEAAEYAGVSEWTLNHLRLGKSDRKGPEFVQEQKGAAVRYRRSALDVWLKERGRR